MVIIMSPNKNKFKIIRTFKYLSSNKFYLKIFKNNKTIKRNLLI